MTTPEKEIPGFLHEELDVLQADIDDETPEILATAVEKALREGALDAHLTPLLMKKGRPGTRLEILCRPGDREKFLRFLVQETSTLGIKARRVDRYALPRHMEEIKVRGHKIAVKVATLDGNILKAAPEFEDCKKAAEILGIPVRVVMEEAKGGVRK